MAYREVDVHLETSRIELYILPISFSLAPAALDFTLRSWTSVSS